MCCPSHVRGCVRSGIAAHKAYQLPCSRVEPFADDRVVPASAFAAREVKVGECLVRAPPRGGAKSGRGDV